MVLKKQILENTQVISLPVRNNYLYKCNVDGILFSAQSGFPLTWETQDRGAEIRDKIKSKREFVDCIYHWLNYENA